MRHAFHLDVERCTGCMACAVACMDQNDLEVEGADGGANAWRQVFQIETGSYPDVRLRYISLACMHCEGAPCLDVCPTGALKIIEREAPAFDEAAAAKVHGEAAATPGGAAAPVGATAMSGASELGQWPIQLHLVSPAAPYFRECDLLIAADCTAFALGSFHAELLRGKALVIACPKLDRTEGYVEKLAELIKSNTVYSITVAIMEVPCCSGLWRIAEEAIARSGKSIAARKVVVGIGGERR